MPFTRARGRNKKSTCSCKWSPRILIRTPPFSTLAKQYNTTLLDIRKPKPTKELKFWTGAISEVEAPRIVVMGTDCAVGKRSTCVLLLQALIQANEKAEMIYTGQTGYLLGYRYGFILDSTLNDFIAGELEAAIMQCVKETQPQWICIEGQSSLQNPSGPCGSEFLLSAQAKYVVLQHAPKRLHFKQKSKKLLYHSQFRKHSRFNSNFRCHNDRYYPQYKWPLSPRDTRRTF